MDVLVIGGSGYLGRRITRQARLAGHRVVATFHANVPPDTDVPAAIIARTSLIVGDGDSKHERLVHALASGTITGALFADEVRCPVHVADLAAALLELATSQHAGVCHVAGADALSRHELGVLIATRDGLAPAALPAGLRAATGNPGPLDVRLDSAKTQARLTTRLRGAREFLAG